MRRAAVSGFIILLLAVPVVKSYWAVTYTPTEVCAFKGSTVEIRCTYTYPSTVNKVVDQFWFTRESNGFYVDLRTDPEYAGRVEYICYNRGCTLRIKDLRESDSAVYKFRFTTSRSTGRDTGEPGVSLSVAEPQLQLRVSQCLTVTELTCHSQCGPPHHHSYVWYKNGEKVKGDKVYFHVDSSHSPADTYHCAVLGHESFPSPSVYAPEPPSVLASPSAEIVEGSSLTLTCSSDANPAAKYTWYKKSEHLTNASGQIFTIATFRPEHSGNYYCEAHNSRGRHNSTLHLNIVKGVWKSAVIGTTSAVFLVAICLLVFLLTRTKRCAKQPVVLRPKAYSGHIFNRLEEQDDLQYASVHFSTSQREPVYSNIRQPAHCRQKEEEAAEYAAVKFNSAGAAPRTRGPKPEEDPSALYSTVNKTP